MISDSAISLLATKIQSTEANIRREYFQHQFLRYFYQLPDSNRVFFKGGTALRVVYNSPRFSEDLDFSSPLSASRLENLIVDTLHHIRGENIEADISEAKQTSGGYLAILNLDRTPVQLEISSRSTPVPNGEPVTVVSDYCPPYTLVILSRDQLVREKLAALQTRSKPRDFYDFYFLLRANITPAKDKQILSQVKKVLEKKDINFTKELKVFLPHTQWPIINDFKATLLTEISRYV